MDKHAGFPQMREVFFALCKSVGTPFALSAWLRFKYDHKSFLELDLDPADYEDAYSFSGDYLVASFLSKWKGLNTGLDLEAEALQRFRSSETSCRETNLRLKEFRNSGIKPRLETAIAVAKRKIAWLLGPFDWSLVCDSYGWGPGATADISRRRAFVDTKLSQTPISVTRRALPVLRAEIDSDLHWSAVILGINVEDVSLPFCFLPHIFSVKEECVIDTVPKNSKTHRVIAKENTGNGFLQKGFGAYFRRRLKRVGIDLDDQSLNQRAAKAAVNEGYATLDLKAASDTVSRELVFELLPVDWALALDTVRSHKAKMPDGEVVNLEKFSSMGNGFTFELESLIFWALTSAEANESDDRERVWIYGDDIICPQSVAPGLIELLEFCGFKTNVSKSFVSGNFFESCGKHYFKGVDVTPVYQKEEVESYEELVRLGNRLIRCAHRFGNYDSLDQRIFAAWSRAWRGAGPSRICQLPLGAIGDDGWVVPADYFTVKPQDPSMGLRCTVMAPHTRVRFPANDGALLAWSLRRGVVTPEAYEGFVETSSPDSTKTAITLRKGGRWVMPTWEFGLSW